VNGLFENCRITVSFCRIRLLHNETLSLSSGRGQKGVCSPYSVRLSFKLSHIQKGITAGLSMANCSKGKDKADEIQTAWLKENQT